MFLLSSLWKSFSRMILSLKYFIIECFVEFSDVGLDFCPPIPEADESKLKFPGMFPNSGRCPEAALVLSDFPYVARIYLSCRTCLAVPHYFVKSSMSKGTFKNFLLLFLLFSNLRFYLLSSLRKVDLDKCLIPYEGNYKMQMCWEE